MRGGRRRNDRRRKRMWKEDREIGRTRNLSHYSPRMPSWLLPFLDLRTDAPRMSWSLLLYGPVWAPLNSSTHHLWDATELLQIARSLSLSLFLFLSIFSPALVSPCEKTDSRAYHKNLSVLSLKLIHSIRTGSIMILV